VSRVADAASFEAAAEDLWAAVGARRADGERASTRGGTVEAVVPPLHCRSATVATDADEERLQDELVALQAAADRAEAAAAAAADAAARAAAAVGDDAATIDSAAASAAAAVAAHSEADARLARQPRVLMAPRDAPAAIAASARIHVLWPDDGAWWPARLVEPLGGGGGGRGDLHPSSSCAILYDTGEEESNVPVSELAAMAGRGEVAWAGQTRAAALAKARPPPRAPPAGAKVSVDTLLLVSGAAIAGARLTLRGGDGAGVDVVALGRAPAGAGLVVRQSDGRNVTLLREQDGVDFTVEVRAQE